MVTVAVDLNKSSRRAANYWRALKGACRADNSVESDVSEFHIIWPLLRYKQIDSNRSVSLLAADCAQSRIGYSMRDSADWARTVGLVPSEDFEMSPSDPFVISTEPILEKAQVYLRQYWPEAAQEFRALTWAIAWVRPKRLNVASLSDPKRFGLVHLNAEMFSKRSAFELATALVHETAHHALYVETAIDPVFQSGAEDLIFSPIRCELRPAIGVLHGLFASFRMIKWAQLLTPHCHSNLEIENEVKRIKNSYLPGFQATGEKLLLMKLTEGGRKLISELIQQTMHQEASP